MAEKKVTKKVSAQRSVHPADKLPIDMIVFHQAIRVRLEKVMVLSSVKSDKYDIELGDHGAVITARVHPKGHRRFRTVVPYANIAYIYHEGGIE